MSPIKKRVQALPFLHASVQQKMSHEGGGEHSADGLDKAIRVPTAKTLPGRRKRGPGVDTLSRIPAWVHAGRNRFDPVHPGQLIRTWNWMVKLGLPPLEPFMTPPGAIRSARTAASKPLASGTGVYVKGPLSSTDE